MLEHSNDRIHVHRPLLHARFDFGNLVVESVPASSPLLERESGPPLHLSIVSSSFPAATLT